MFICEIIVGVSLLDYSLKAKKNNGILKMISGFVMREGRWRERNTWIIKHNMFLW